MSKNAEKLLSALGEVDDKYIELSKPEMNIAAKKRFRVPKWLPAAACVVLAAGVLVGAKLREKYHISYNVVQVTMMTCDWRSGTYTLNVDKAEVPAEYIGEALGTGQVTGFKSHNFDEQGGVVEAEIFSVKNVSADCAIAVLPNGEDKFIPLVKSDYYAGTLRDFFEGFNIKEYGRAVRLTNYPGGRSEVYAVSDGRMWDILFSEPDVPALSERVRRSDSYFAIDLEVPLLGLMGDSELRLELDDAGQLRVKMVGGLFKTFSIGAEKYRAAVEHFKANYELVDEFIYGSVNNAPDTSEYAASDGGMISPAFDPYA